MKRRTKKQKMYAEFRAPVLTKRTEEVEDYGWFVKDISKTIVVCCLLVFLLVVLYQRLSI